VLAGLSLLAGAPAAGAHAILVRSSPLPGQELAASPPTISATFSEPVNRALSSLTLIGPGGRTPPTRRLTIGAETLELVASRRLARGVYAIRWHSVSAVDGHELDGAYYFGVGAYATTRTTSSLGDPLGRGGWLRVSLRVLADAALVAFCGGVFCAALLGSPTQPAGWLVPETDALGPPAAERRLLWRRVVAVGALAVAADATRTLADAANAGNGLDGATLHAYLLSNLTGVGRLIELGALAASALFAARRLPWSSAVAALVALVGLTLAGHANSASPRGVAIASDLVHLAAGSLWLGGIVQIAWAWLPRLRGLDLGRRRLLLERVLPRFGRLALPAFATVLVAGVVNAAIELGSLSALWNTGYGVVLLVKAAFVGTIALVSYGHALRLRPRLLRSTEGERRAERLHWRLLGGEPLLALGVVGAAGLLVAYAAPNRSGAAAEAASHARGLPATARPLALALAADQMTVAEEAGPDIVAAWVTHAGGRLSVQVHALNVSEDPAAIPVRIRGVAIGGRCGLGCYRTTLPGGTRTLTLSVHAKGTTWTTRLPVHFDSDGNALAQALVSRVSAGQVQLRSAAVHESLRGTPTVPDVTVYRIQAPDRFAYELSHGTTLVADTIIVGTGEWTRAAGQRSWQYASYGTQPWSAASYFSWWGDYATLPRLLDVFRSGGTRYADVATLAQVDGLGPVWLRLRFDLTHDLLLRLRMITAGHFMSQAWSGFDAPQRIVPPR